MAAIVSINTLMRLKICEIHQHAQTNLTDVRFRAGNIIPDILEEARHHVADLHYMLGPIYHECTRLRELGSIHV